ncbi:hypothetical protein [Campylobacter upsaliensis]|uniref:hypothetical protein n=1 Tax=Campylobacter upsaliensis TaxID=28080 RepID=UPI0022EB7C47|nr:hypothetical protein [Campylobacter upsaliensis]
MAKIKILAGTYAGNEYRYVKNCDEMKQMKGSKNNPEKFYLSNIASFELKDKDSSKKLTETIFGAIIGNMINPAGAIVGATAAGNQPTFTIIFTYENGTQSLAQIDNEMHTILQTMLFDKNSFKLQHCKSIEKSKFWKYALIFLIAISILYIWL